MKMDAIHNFPTASKELISSRSLQERCDTKFICKITDLGLIFKEVTGHYHVIRKNEEVYFEYMSQYFDTEDNKFLNDHHRGRRPRIKVRQRHYTQRGLSFLEMKKKCSDEKTYKTRKQIDNPDSIIEVDEFLATKEHSISEKLVPKLKVTYQRMTLIGLMLNERVTVDINIQFEYVGKSKTLNGLVIIEVKQSRFNPQSPIIRTLYKHARDVRVSKYMTGAQLMWPEMKLNRHKPRFKAIMRCIK